ncbi:MAG: hypothetical protein KJ638_10675 [Chloroflexi bacterium]|nr:hypothetical protein [Chloroflexota bacterium]
MIRCIRIIRILLKQPPEFQVTVEVEHPTAGRVKIGASPLNVVTAPPTVRYPPPLLGEHNAEILRDVPGYDDERIAELREDGLI